MIYTQRERERVLIKIKLSFVIPTGFYGKIVERSSLANVRGISEFNGTVDTDYRRTVCVVLLNLSNNEYIVEIGNLIAQLIIEKCMMLSLFIILNCLTHNVL